MVILAELLTLFMRVCYAVIIGCIAYAYVKMFKESHTDSNYTNKIFFWGR